MYYYIKGQLVSLMGDFAVLDVGGIGYKLYVSGNTHQKLASFTEKSVLLYTYFNIREDAQELYGFYTEEERECFIKLISVSGVGPKAATSILSLYTPESLASLVSAGDAKAISRANGIGLKTAQKVIIELKGKLDLSVEASNSPNMPLASSLSDAADTLMVLGYSKAEAAEALKGIDSSLSVEAIITAALGKLNKFR